MSEMSPDGRPIIRAITYLDGPNVGSWLSIEDFRAYLTWLAGKWPDDAVPLTGIADALTEGIIHRQ